jgi:hypothetical protein
MFCYMNWLDCYLWASRSVGLDHTGTTENIQLGYSRLLSQTCIKYRTVDSLFHEQLRSTRSNRGHIQLLTKNSCLRFYQDDHGKKSKLMHNWSVTIFLDPSKRARRPGVVTDFALCVFRDSISCARRVAGQLRWRTWEIHRAETRIAECPIPKTRMYGVFMSLLISVKLFCVQM